jgi:hypothetical protein
LASLVLLKNPLAPHPREQHPLAAGTPVIDWLQQHHPAGFGMPIRFYVNGSEKELDDLDYAVEEDDVAVIALMLATYGRFGVYATIALVLNVLMLLGMFGKKEPQRWAFYVLAGVDVLAALALAALWASLAPQMADIAIIALPLIGLFLLKAVLTLRVVRGLPPPAEG